MNSTYNKISKQAIKVKNIEELLFSAIGMIILAILLWCSSHFNWWSWVPYVLIGLIILDLLGIVWTFKISSPLFYKTFGYSISDDYLFIKKGIWTRKEIVVPMTKIQSIEITQGIISRKYDVSTIEVNTMQGEHSIPYIDSEIAKTLRDDIAKLARLKELDE